MTITAATTTSDFAGMLNPEQAAAIFERAARSSAVQQLAPQVPLGANGKAIPVVTGKLTAGWTAEGAKKHTSKGTMDLKTMKPQKLTTIAVVSAEVVRANPANYMDLIKNQVGDAFAEAFDAAALHGTNSPFATYIAQTAKAVELGTSAKADGGIHADLNAGLSLLVNDGKRLNGFALDDRFEPLLNGAVDASGRPIYVDSPVAEAAGPFRSGRLMGRAAFLGEGIYDAATSTYGFGGDWSQTAWGVVGGISYKVSTEAAVTINGELVSLFENNLVAILAEAEYGWLVNDVDAFVEYKNAVA